MSKLKCLSEWLESKGVESLMKNCFEGSKTPDYSFDKWLKKTQKLGDEVSDMAKKSKDDEKSLEDREKEIYKKEISKKDKEEKPSIKKSPFDQSDREDKSDKNKKWDNFKQFHAANDPDNKKQDDEDKKE